MRDDEQMAERVARSEFGDEWGDLDPRLKAVRIDIWSGLIEEIRRAGLEIVEAEEGR